MVGCVEALSGKPSASDFHHYRHILIGLTGIQPRQEQGAASTARKARLHRPLRQGGMGPQQVRELLLTIRLVRSSAATPSARGLSPGPLLPASVRTVRAAAASGRPGEAGGRLTSDLRLDLPSGS